jgi:hypothetical protein
MSNESTDKNIMEDFFAKEILHKVLKYITTHNYIEIKKRLIKIPDTFGGTREMLIKPKILRINAYPDYILVEKNDMIKDENYKLVFDVKLGYRSYSIYMLVGINNKNVIDIINAEIIGGRIR